MLFDLRARGRRRTVQFVYVGLALLFLIGYIGFNVGSGATGGGGIFESVFGGKERSTSFASQVASAEKRVRIHPQEAQAWAKLVEARWHQASEEKYIGTKGFNEQGKALLVQLASDWRSYLALKPSQPNLTAATDMLGVYGKGALEQPNEAVKLLQQVMIPAKPPSAALYGQLAAYAYQASNTSLGDLASKKAVSLAPARQRPLVKEQLAKIKANPSGEPRGENFQAQSGNGQTYNVKLNANGKGTAVPAPSKPASKKK
jgi:hypothetical protein